MSRHEGERHNGDGVTVQGCLHIQAPANADVLNRVGLLKMDYYRASTTARGTATFWVDVNGYFRIYGIVPTAADLLLATTIKGVVVGDQT